MSDEHPYEVGYGRPPRHTRFQKGRSGNPRGRPKGSKNLATLVAEALDRRVAVNGNRKRRRITMREVIIAELVEKSAAADLKAMAMLFGLMHQTDTRDGAGDAPSTAADEAVVENLIARIRDDDANR